MAYCTNCGAEINESVNFCPVCGAKQNDGIESANRQEKIVTVQKVYVNEPTKTSVFAILGFVFAILPFVIPSPLFYILGLVLSLVGLCETWNGEKKGDIFAFFGSLITITMLIIAFIIVRG